MGDPKPVASPELVVLPACEACGHPASEHVGPDMKCRICGDRYIAPDDNDLPSDVLVGE